MQWERAYYYFRENMFCEAGRVFREKCGDLLSENLHAIGAVICDAMVGDPDAAVRDINAVENNEGMNVIRSTAKYVIYSRCFGPRSSLAMTEVGTIDANWGECDNFEIALICAKIALLGESTDIVTRVCCGFLQDMGTRTIFGWSMLQQKRYKEALSLFESTTRDAFSVWGLGLALAGLGRVSEAIDQLEHVSSTFRFREMHFEIGRLLLYAGKWDEAVRSAKRACGRAMNDMFFYVVEAIAAIVGYGTPVNCSKTLSHVIDICKERESGNWILLSYLARIFAAFSGTTYHETSIMTLMAIEHANDRSAGCFALQGFHSMIAGDMGDAIVWFERALEVDTVNVEAAELLVEVLFDLNRKSDAIDILEMYSAVEFETAAIIAMKYSLNMVSFGALVNACTSMVDNNFTMLSLNGLGHGFFTCLDLILAGDFYLHEWRDKLERVFDYIQKIYPGYIPFIYFRGIWLRLTKRPFEAIDCFEKILRSTWIFRVGRCLTELAFGYYAVGSRDAARKCIEEARRRFPPIVTNVNYILARYYVLGIPYDFSDMISGKPFPVVQRMIEATIHMKRFDTALSLLAKASVEVTSREQKVMLLVYRGQIHAGRSDLTKAFDCIQRAMNTKLRCEDVYQAKADIHLEYNSDKEKFIKVLIRLCQKGKTRERRIMLGDGYARIGDRISARNVYESVLAEKTDCWTVHKFVQASCSTYLFADIKVDGYESIPLNIIDLLIDLGRNEETERILEFKLESSESCDEYQIAMLKWRLGKVKVALGDMVNGLKLFTAAKSALESVKIGNDDNFVVQECKRTFSRLLFELGTLYAKKSEMHLARSHYSESLLRDETNREAVMKLLAYFSSIRKYNRCATLCTRFLASSEHDTAMALQFSLYSYGNFASVLKYLTKSFQKSSNREHILIRMVEIGVRAGRFTGIKQILRSAAVKGPCVDIAKGMYYANRRKPKKAIASLRKAVKSSKWREIAYGITIDVLLNPDLSFPFLPNGTSVDTASVSEAVEIMSKMELNEHATALLLAEIDITGGTSESRARATCVFTHLLKENDADLRARVGLAECQLISGFLPEAQATLQPILDVTPILSTFAYFEAAYMMMAFMAYEERHYTAATFHLQKVVTMNRCCVSAWEMMGRCHMHDMKFDSAAYAFSMVWRLSVVKDCNLGYDYADACLRSGQWRECLSVCRDILVINPEFRDIKESIARPCFHGLMRSSNAH